jgi:hypothetical protein
LEEYTFLQNSPAGAEYGFEVSLFNQPQHLLLQAREGWHTFYVLHTKHQRIEALLHLHLKDAIARSPFSAPFGSVEFSPKLPPDTLFQFLEFVEVKIRARGVKTIIIKNPPHDYNPVAGALLQVFFSNQGYQIALAETGSMIAVQEYSERSLARLTKRNLRGARDARLEFRKVSADYLEVIYAFILACRKQKNYSLSMTLAALREAFDQFPQQYVLFGVYQEDTLVAASIAIHVNSRVLYNFYADHAMAFDHLSPVVLLTEGLVRYAQEQKAAWLDLGTSALEDKPNFGLLDFKLRLGGKPTAKLTFEKVLT